MITINGDSLTVDQVIRVAEGYDKVVLSKGAEEKIRKSRMLVEDLMKDGKVIYGVTTGFGDLISKKIESREVVKLQENLIRSHSSGYGNPVEERVVRAMMLIRANSLAKGYSGVRLEVVEALLNLLNLRIVPFIPEKGSVGSSGDLSPLAHLASVLTGEGKVLDKGKEVDSSPFLEERGFTKIKLEAKEGISLINGTSYMLANLTVALKDAENIIKHSIITSAMAFHVLKATESALDPRLFAVRPYTEHSIVAREIKKLIDGSTRVLEGSMQKVQDAYTLRCTPTVLGSILQTLNFVRGIVERELNSATDNPLVFDEIISGCNFHGEPLALAADYLSVALTELGNLIERRIFRVLDSSLSGLKPFLADNPGIESGLMIAQYVAAALCNENKVLSYPSSADTIPTSANQEDHNSMGATSTRKLLKIAENVRGIVAVEMLVSYKGMLMYGVSGEKLESIFRILYDEIGNISGDRETTSLIKKLTELIDSERILNHIPVSIR
ncbi:MAG: histidine ammonia-lyase [Thermoplasmatales archaeon]